MKNTIRFAAAVVCLFTAILAAAPMAMAQNTATLPLVLPVGGPRDSLVIISNNSARAGTITIRAIDDTGERFGPVTLSIDANAGARFHSRDLEQGNPARLSSGIGDGEGNWRLEFESDLDFEALAYVRTSDGFLTSMHDKVPETAGTHRVVFFNPASNISKQSRLRLVNSGTAAAEVTISARDETGVCATDGLVTLTIPAGESRTLTAQALEAGGDGFTGSFGDGSGKWRLFITSNVPIEAMSLLSSASGHLANLSTISGGPFDASADSCRGTTEPTVPEICPEAEVFITPGNIFEFRGTDGDVVRLRLLAGMQYENAITRGRGISFSYSKTAADMAQVTFTDSEGSCTSSLVCTSGTEGTFRSDCDADGTAPWVGNWSLSIPEPVLGCANDAAFNALVLGKRIVTDSSEIRFMEGNRIRETFPAFGTSLSGSYTYGKTSPNTGTMQIRYDNGLRCDVSLSCTSPTVGTLSSNCGVSVRNESWRIIP